MIVIFLCALFLVLFCSSLLMLITTLITDPNGGNYAPLLLFFFSMVLYLITLILFSRNTNRYPRNDSSEYCVEHFETFIHKKVICFEKRNGVWICQRNGQVIKLDLTGYVFPKAYIKSYVIRNLRYPMISDKTPLINLFKNKYPIKGKKDLDLVLVDGCKTHIIRIIKNGISKYGFLSREITKTPEYITFILSNRSVYTHLKKHASPINEKIYKFGIRNKS